VIHDLGHEARNAKQVIGQWAGIGSLSGRFVRRSVIMRSGEDLLIMILRKRNGHRVRLVPRDARCDAFDLGIGQRRSASRLVGDLDCCEDLVTAHALTAHAAGQACERGVALPVRNGVAVGCIP